MPKLETVFQAEKSLAECILPTLTVVTKKKIVWKGETLYIHYDNILPRLGPGMSAPIDCKAHTSDKGHHTVEDVIQLVSSYYDRKDDKDMLKFIRLLKIVRGLKSGEKSVELDGRSRREKLAGKSFKGFEIDHCDNGKCIATVIEKGEIEEIHLQDKYIEDSEEENKEDEKEENKEDEKEENKEEEDWTYAGVLKRGLKKC
ncbi:Hypothetical protein HVR_LOCUS326 [uncultured virus]|nr:Hypothetical protein HVR_LOCUS326 [uncultured virus]